MSCNWPRYPNEAIVAAAADPLVGVLADGTLRALNQAALDLVRRQASAPGSTLRELIHPEDLPVILERHRLRLAGGTSSPRYRFRVLRRPGQYIRV